MTDSYTLIGALNKIGKRIYENPVIEQADFLLHQAISLKVSDIHFQPCDQESLLVRYRIDGLLHDWERLDRAHSMAIISRLKLMAGIDIAQQRKPQDGKLNIVFEPDNLNEQKRLIDFRFSTFPSIYGEKLVIRILDSQHGVLHVDQLGFSEQIHKHLEQLMRTQQGFFLVTGPTGSGKTTTLYALLLACNRTCYNVVTIEDPVEYTIPGIMQSQVNIQAGLTFDNSLRSLLRQDPDIIMIGEIRDRETAKTALESALTGHLVFSTLHTQDALSVITRLMDMGIEPFLISATLSGILAQRLMRRLCQECKEPHLLSDAEQKLFLEIPGPITTIYKPKGCSHCHSIGYKGRIGIFEFLPIDNHVRDLIMQKDPTATLRSYTKQQGLETLFHAGLSKVIQGETSLQEVLAL